MNSSPPPLFDMVEDKGGGVGKDEWKYGTIIAV
jgi:hypothetical protein